tara:strand:- start:76 stop:414 length:339 start_codon:yes stop_codon:yes gene_type:complete
MAITKTWEVNTCRRFTVDGFINKIIYRVKTEEDGVEIDGTRHTGSVTFTKPETLPNDFINYDKEAKTPSQEIMIGWIKNTLGADEVTRIESAIDEKVNLIKMPNEEEGTPWS